MQVGLDLACNLGRSMGDQVYVGRGMLGEYFGVDDGKWVPRRRAVGKSGLQELGNVANVGCADKIEASNRAQ